MLNTVALTLDTFRGNARSMKSFFSFCFITLHFCHILVLWWIRCHSCRVHVRQSVQGVPQLQSHIPVNTCSQTFGSITQYITLWASSCSSSTFRHVCVIGWNHQKPLDRRSARISNLVGLQWFELCWPIQSFRSNNTSGARRLACIHKLN